MMRVANRNGGYLGSGVVQRKQDTGVDTCLVYCEVGAIDADVMGNEPVYSGDDLVGITTSGAFGHYVKKSLAFAYVKTGYHHPDTSLEVEILGKRCEAKVLPQPAWDPANSRLRS